MKKINAVPVALGRDYPITIHDLGSHGEGVGRYEGFTVFVAGALPGETVRATILTLKKKYAVGDLREIITASPDRVTPPEGNYPEVGIYPLVTWDYEAQLRWKRARVAHLLTHIGGIDVAVEPVIGMADPFHYRNKIQVPVGLRDGRPAIGFYERQSHDIVDMTTCLLQDPATNRLLAAVRKIRAELATEPYDERTGTGVLRHVVGRTGEGGKVMAILVTATRELPDKERWIERLREEVPELVSLYQNIQKERTNVILGKTMKHLWGHEVLAATIGDLRFALSPGSFFQVNPVQTRVLYETALQAARLTGQETVIDAYCGTGTISLFLARQAQRVIGVEKFAPAVKDARNNARLNGLENASFIAGDTAEILPQLAAQGVTPDVIVMDPARAGCDEKVLATVADWQPSRIVYVSCNPATLARDAAYLATRGYAVTYVQPVDMFPHTTHIEVIALLSKLDSKKYISVELPMDHMDLTSAESKATYKQIQNYVFEKFGFKVSNLYIAQVKEKYGIKERENYNKSKNEDSKQPICPAEKEEAIKDAFRHFKML